MIVRAYYVSVTKTKKKSFITFAHATTSKLTSSQGQHYLGPKLQIIVYHTLHRYEISCSGQLFPNEPDSLVTVLSYDYVQIRLLNLLIMLYVQLKAGHIKNGVGKKISFSNKKFKRSNKYKMIIKLEYVTQAFKFLFKFLRQTHFQYSKGNGRGALPRCTT